MFLQVVVTWFFGFKFYRVPLATTGNYYLQKSVEMPILSVSYDIHVDNSSQDFFCKEIAVSYSWTASFALKKKSLIYINSQRKSFLCNMPDNL
jgi:hypothetical protein